MVTPEAAQRLELDPHDGTHPNTYTLDKSNRLRLQSSP